MADRAAHTLTKGMIPQPKPLNLKSSNLAEEWRKFHRSYKLFELATGYEGKTGGIRVAALLSIMGEEGCDLYDTCEWDTPEDANKFNIVIKKFEEFCIPRKNLLFETFKFGSRRQKENENIDCFVTELRKLAANCEFGDKERRIRDQVVLGLRDEKVQERVLREQDPSLDAVLAIIRASEVAEKQTQEIFKEKTAEEEVHLMRKKNKPQNNHKPQNNEQKPSKGGQLIKCKFCDKQHEKVKEKCPAWGKVCKGCKGKNHFVVCCKGSVPKERTHHIKSDEVYTTHNQSKKKKTKTVTIQETGQNLKFEIDSGASCNIISIQDYKRVTKDKRMRNVRKTHTPVTAYGGEQLKQMGEVDLCCDVGGAYKIIKCVVIKNSGVPLLGISSSVELGLISFHDCDNEESVNSLNVDDSLIKSYVDVFSGLGKLEGQCKIELVDGAKPVVHAPRRVPAPMIEPLKNWIEEQEKIGVIKKVDKPTPWVSSITLVRTPNKLRVCLDPKELNNAIKREHYQLPTVEEVVARIPKAKVFSVIDAKWGFWQIELDEDSSYLTTFHTPFGRYRFIRLPFGICSASEIFQKRSHEFAEDLDGVEVIADDFLVVGCGETEEKAIQDHDVNLKKLLDKARRKNLKLNPDKLKLRMSKVTFVGHLLTQEGLQPDPKKVEAVTKMPNPTDVEGVRRFLGMVQYLAKFLPRLSEETEPLRRLTDLDAEWEWSDIHQRSFDRVKVIVSSAPILKYYDVNSPVMIECDSSDKGIGSVLLQDGRPVAFSSRSMTKTEQRYAQIEKELLAIVHSCTRFHHYVYGKPKVIVKTDHKPLENIFKKPICSVPKRLQRMLVALTDYDLVVQYQKGKEMFISDTLSRAFLDETGSEEVNLIHEIEEIYEDEKIPNSSKRLDEIKEATEKDATLVKVKSYIQGGWPEKAEKVDPSCVVYFKIAEELVERDGLIQKGDRVVIPAAERRNCMEKIHSSHIGIEGCLRRARELIYWPGMNAELKDFMSKCEICNSFRKQQQKEPLMSHPVPDRPWSVVSGDLFDFEKTDWLILVDHYSNYFCVEKITGKSAAVVIKAMKKMFADHGVPDKFVSDNQPFDSKEFKAFADKWNFKNVTSSPTYPQSNGKVENAVKTCKYLLKKAVAAKGDFWQALLDWRNTPNAEVGLSPSQRLYGRRTKTTFPTNPVLLKPSSHHPAVKEKLEEAREKQKSYYDRGAKELKPLTIGDIMRMKLPGKDVWSKGVVQKKWGKRAYVVKVGEGTYRRNRRQLIATSEYPENPAPTREDANQDPPLRRSQRLIEKNMRK